MPLHVKTKSASLRGRFAHAMQLSVPILCNTTPHTLMPHALVQAGSAACYAYDAAKHYGVFDKIKNVGQATLEKVCAFNS